MEKAIFLDRDGVLTKEKSYVLSLKELEIFRYSKQCVSLMHDLGYRVIVVTNQSAIGRGWLSKLEMEKMNIYLIEKTGVDSVYYCPHYFSKNATVECNLKYFSKCNCRKPNTGLIEQAMRDFQVTYEGTFFVGDRATDIQAGEKMGFKTVLLESGYGTNRLEKAVKPDYVLKDLEEFTKLLGLLHV